MLSEVCYVSVGIHAKEVLPLSTYTKIGLYCRTGKFSVDLRQSSFNVAVVGGAV